MTLNKETKPIIYFFMYLYCFQKMIYKNELFNIPLNSGDKVKGR